jgi:hypothetical protein
VNVMSRGHGDFLVKRSSMATSDAIDRAAYRRERFLAVRKPEAEAGNEGF